jgi:hypothetical protein
MSDAYLYALIIGCEAAFWVVLLVALCVRYLLKRVELSKYLLLLLPVVDLLLLGFTVAFGSVMVAWADKRFAHRFAGGPQPAPNPKHGWPALRYELLLWVRCIAAWVIAVPLLIGLIYYVNDPARTVQLEAWFHIAVGSIFAWFVFGPLWVLVFSMRTPKENA